MPEETSNGPTMLSTKMRWFSLVLVVTYVLDQATKYAIIERFHYGERLPVIDGLFTLTHVRNPGGAFSFFASGPVEQRMLFFIGSTLIAIVLLIVFVRRLEPEARLSAFALGAIMGGAIGNLTDRIVHREVIDFLDVHLWGGYTWPTFNVADSAIVVGVAILLVEIFFERGPEDEGSPRPLARDTSRAG